VTLGHVRRLLAPGGALLLLEGTERQRWVDLTFGLLEGWWKFTDLDRRPSHALLTQAQWKSALEDFGFVDVDSVPRRKSPQALIVAKTPMTVGGAEQAEARRSWLLIGDNHGYATEVAGRLQKVGASVHLVSAEDFAAGRIDAKLGRLDGKTEIVHLASLELREADRDLPGRAATTVLAGIARLVSALADSGRVSPPRLWLATRGAQSPNGTAIGLQPLQATTWGFGRVIALEHPEHWGGVIDLDPNERPGDAAASLISEIISTNAEDQVALRGGVRYVPRIVRADALDGARVTFRDDASYLITGGTGGIALSLVRWMADRGAKHLVLVSRQGLPARSTWDTLPADHPTRRLGAMIHELDAQGTRVEVVACDVTDEQAIASLVATFGSARPPLRGIMHAAAAIAGGEIRHLDQDAIASMLAPKVDGTRLLDRLTRGLGLDHFVLFSSTTALWGVAGLAHYAAANEYLDQVALERAAAGLPALSVNWGTWEDMRLASEEDRRTFVRSGLNPMPSSSALERLERLMGQQAHRKIVAAVDWSVLKPVYEAKRMRPMLAEVTPLLRKTTVGESNGADSQAIVGWLREGPAVEQRDRVIAYLREQVAAVLGLPEPHTIRLDEGLFDLGMDSLMSVELKNRLESGLEQPLPSTLTFNYPNVGALADYVTNEVLREIGATPPAAPTAVGTSTVEELDDMSEDELADLLAARLRKH
jgi:NAD(P)-dependent dehydrogenase (short-subunit alcohol dehydrogenase family)/acyl carrier protein